MHFKHSTLLTNNETECLSFISGCVIQVAKCLKENWLVVL